MQRFRLAIVWTLLWCSALSATATSQRSAPPSTSLRRRLRQLFYQEDPLISLSKSFLYSEGGGASFSVGGDFDLSSLTDNHGLNYAQPQYQYAYNQPMPLPYPGPKGRFEELKNVIGNAVYGLRADMLHKGSNDLSHKAQDLQLLARASAESMQAKAMAMEAKAAQPKPSFTFYPATIYKYVANVPQQQQPQGSWVQVQKPMVTVSKGWDQQSAPGLDSWAQKQPVNVYLTGRNLLRGPRSVSYH